MSNPTNQLVNLLLKDILKQVKDTPIPKNVDLEKGIETFINTFIKSEKEEVKKETSVNKEMINYYNNLINETFIHTSKRTKYVLLELLNTETTDITKFPVLVSYYDKQLKTKWCRPLLDFHNNFKLVS